MADRSIVPVPYLRSVKEASGRSAMPAGLSSCYLVRTMGKGHPQPSVALWARLDLDPRPAMAGSLRMVLIGSAVGIAAIGTWWCIAYGSDGFHRPGDLGVALAIATALPLAAPRRFWLLALALSAMSLLAYDLVGFAPSPVILAPAALLCCVLATAPLAECLAACGFVVAGALTSGVLGPGKAGMLSLIGEALALLLTVIAGTAMRSRQHNARSRGDEPQEHTQVAVPHKGPDVLKDRLALARELHDSVGHGVSLMALQTAAARALVDKDPERARQLLARNDEIASGTMAELRRVLGLLR
ncbi:MAG: histidine kinase dimerization/phosphoacceptor domain-containing protein, partial [Acidimicrobiales bacterium]